MSLGDVIFDNFVKPLRDKNKVTHTCRAILAVPAFPFVLHTGLHLGIPTRVIWDRTACHLLNVVNSSNLTEDSAEVVVVGFLSECKIMGMLENGSQLDRDCTDLRG